VSCTTILESNVIGNVLKNIGSSKFKAISEQVASAVEEYNSALRTFGYVLGVANYKKTVANYDVTTHIESMMVEMHEDFNVWKPDGSTSVDQVLNWIFDSDIDSKYRSVKQTRIDNSGTWFLNHAQFQKWLVDENAPILYTPGLRSPPFCFNKL
jgi:hypothetical protein